jgi:excinuclease ABC subunit A
MSDPADVRPADRPPIRIRGARQNNLRNLDIDIPTHELVVVTGVSGSGKSSLVFDTLYAEGQRRYVETFSAYARQFLDRMDKPQVDRIEGVPPAIAIDQTNPVRTSRSTVGTMTELNDHLKLLFARAGRLHCRRCARPVARDTVATITAELHARAAAAGDPRLVIGFPVQVPANFTEAEIEQHLLAQGYTRVHARLPGSATVGPTLVVVQDRLRLAGADPGRVGEALEAALHRGAGRVQVHALDDAGGDAQVWRWSSALACADCGIAYSDPSPSLFSFNSPIGACETCRGFGRVIGIDLGLVIPDGAKTLGGGAVKPWQTESYKECQKDLERHARAHGVALDVAWRDLPAEHRDWVIEGGADWKGDWTRQWYGVRRFFDWLESKAYKMHIRVLLSRYRAYTPCTACGGARLRPDALLWRIGSDADATAAFGGGHGRYRRFMPAGVEWSAERLDALPGLCVHDVMLLPIERVAGLFATLQLPAPFDEATALLLTEIRARLRYLMDVGLSYLTLDRQSRTLSGGEVQRINLTTALGTSLVNTLFVLDEPSIGLHPRDMNRVIGVMKRLRDAGNSLVVVEHDPQVMFAADRMLDIGPGPGERGGRIVYWGEPEGLRRAQTLTGDYLSGRRTLPASQLAPVTASTPRLVLEGARAHNLRSVDVEIPLGRLVCLTGVSGSGKSTLMQDVLLPALLKAKGKPTETPGEHDRLLGDDWIEDVVFVDQSPIGKTTRSNPVSYVGAFDAIRKRFAAAEVSRERGYTAGTFSFNAGDGRCPTCGGNGFEHVEMQFLSDVYLRCPDCDGRRFRPEILEVMIRGRDGERSVADVLELTVHEAIAFFGDDWEIATRLQPLEDVGLDYLRLGQPVPTLSGGEAQRLKLAGFLAEAATRGLDKARSRRGTLFLFDEPTTGLHFDDVARLLRALRKLLAAGHSLLVIEHNLDVMRAADWLIDLGPDGGDAGGRVVAVGTPATIAAHPDSVTGRSLREYAEQLQASYALAAAPHRAEDAALDAAAAAGSDMAPAGVADGSPHADDDPGAPLQSLLRQRARDSIFVHNAREHNLKNVDVEVPRNRMTVITGVSGSGKSTLAFDVIFGEGQRRYLESLNAYARQFVQPASRPDVDGVFGIPPTVAIEQRTSRGGRKSTVATLTEIYHFLRLLYVKLGTQYCPKDGTAIEPQSFDAIAARILREHRGQRVGLLAPLVVGRKGLYTDLAKWAAARGHTHLRVDGVFVPTGKWPRLDRYVEHDIELPVADLVVSPERETELRDRLRDALGHGKGIVMVATGLEALEAAIAAGDPTGREAPLRTTLHSTKRACSTCGTSYPELDPRLFSFNSKHGWCGACLGAGLETVGRIREDELTPGMEGETDSGITYGEAPCPACEGRRLNPIALSVRLREHSIAALTGLPVDAARDWIGRLDFSGREAEIARDVLAEIGSRLRFLSDVGLGYLSLARAAPTLSGGEAQRIRLAAQLGSNLQGVCYVLDEPTIGLHPRDNRVLLDTLEALRDKGNTLLVVEHDEDTIRRADNVIDIGPGAGRLGGRIVASGHHSALAAQPDSLTGRFLSQPLQHPLHPPRPVATDSPALFVRGATLHNLRSVDARVPLGRLTVVTGVSGSGKSTFARDVLLANLQSIVTARNAGRTGAAKAAELAAAPVGCAAIEGVDEVGRVLEVDQTPIGKTPRSCPATYIGFWDAIRRLFADTTEARVRGYEASRFSFNTGSGRCPACEGQGVQTIEMSFLPDVKVLCDVCGGQRFNRETLQVTLRGRSVGEVLAMSVDEALPFFDAHPSIAHPLKLMQDVGLGYLTLGQPSPTLSGGEAQRIKLVTELAKVRDGGAPPGRAARGAPVHTLYVLDEPTVGLHMADVDRLIHVLHRLVDAGNTLVVIEHDIDLWAEADWIIDLGPEGGDGGGRVVDAAPPTELAERGIGHTGRVLREFYAARRERRAA